MRIDRYAQNQFEFTELTAVYGLHEIPSNWDNLDHDNKYTRNRHDLLVTYCNTSDLKQVYETFMLARSATMRWSDFPTKVKVVSIFCTLPPVNRMTDRSKNITLSQTLFVGDNKEITNTTDLKIIL